MYPDVAAVEDDPLRAASGAVHSLEAELNCLIFIRLLTRRSASILLHGLQRCMPWGVNQRLPMALKSSSSTSLYLICTSSMKELTRAVCWFNGWSADRSPRSGTVKIMTRPSCDGGRRWASPGVCRLCGGRQSHCQLRCYSCLVKVGHWTWCLVTPLGLQIPLTLVLAATLYCNNPARCRA